MLPENFLPDEFLYRGVHQDQYDPITEKVFSSAFKDSHGASVDRNWTRDREECIGALLNRRRFSGIIRVSVQNVIDCNALAVYLPDPENRYHSEIHDQDNPTLHRKKAKCLSEKAELVYRQNGS